MPVSKNWIVFLICASLSIVQYLHVAYQTFVRRVLTEHEDHALTWYVDYQRARCQQNVETDISAEPLD